MAILLNVDTILLGDLVGDVRNEGELDVTKPSLLAGGLGPSKVNKVGVNRGSQHLDSRLLELSNLVAELDDLSGAHKGEV